MEAVHFLRMQNLRGKVCLFPDSPIRELCMEVGYRDVRFVQKRNTAKNTDFVDKEAAVWYLIQ